MLRTVILGVSAVVFTYIALAYSQGVSSEAKTFTASYGRMAKAFRGE